ncbi:MAG: hypothetical protein WBA13_01790 [Microcoleaceae cyanobacterium]
MKYSQNLYAQLRAIKLTLLMIFIATAVLVGIVFVVHFQTGAAISQLTRDPVIVFKESAYIGFLSQVGIFFWAGASVICLYTTYILANGIGNLKLEKFFLGAGLLSLLLGLDDVFMLHETFSAYANISEKKIFAGYLALLLLWVFKFYSIIFRTEYLLLGIALAFFGLSIIIDIAVPDIPNIILLEDGAKLIGILTWMAYFFRCGASAIGRYKAN